jgi:hypothetical protein
MAARALSAVGLVTLLALFVPRLASGGDLRLAFQNGRVTLIAQDVPLREILAEWERVGGTRVVNRDAAPAASVTLDLSDVPEARALAILLQQVAGYFASERTTLVEASSRFTRIVIMPGAERLAAVLPAPAPAGAQPAGTSAGARTGQRPRVQRKPMPDGRVVSDVGYEAPPVEQPVVEDADEIPELPLVEVPENRVRPFPPGAAPDPASADDIPNLPPAAQGAGGRGPLPARMSPTVPVTVAKAGTIIPGSKPGPIPYRPQEVPPQPPPPIRPPDI